MSSKVPGEDPAPGKQPSSGRRALQAQQTHRDILAAARSLFAAKGYAGTTLKDVAREAVVSVQTIYDSVGGKADLLRSLNDHITSEAGIAEISRAVGQEADPAVLIRIPARITRQLVERCGDILRAVQAGSLAEPELAPVLAEGQRRHRDGTAGVARRLCELGALRAGVSEADASTTIAALADFRLAIVLLDEFGLDSDRLEDWIATTTARAVLAPDDC
ncbi:MAG TPA: helix-turn-helix domain-containing protein [Streptosporangiaceae bacterium]|nr:helix-turn-helix domain-containing protein [Streptosporangiaceae bacterium]